ncbi:MULTISPECIES: helix-turn-helix transcriptional regulator [unclassified Micromonospora]|uniref:helix-turn-helix transcriptional regulator n=1 Tax=unclassified Micromonospora TaxID=2617518 RepID=UPI003A8581C2
MTTVGSGALLTVVEAVSRSRDLGEFAEAGCRELFRLMPCVSVSYTEVNLRTEVVSGYLWPYPGIEWFERYAAPLGRIARQNPLVAHIAGGGSVASWADVDPKDAFRQTALFQEFYAANGIESQAALGVLNQPGLVTGFTVNRDGSPFSADEYQVLCDLRPHLINLYRLVSGSGRARANDVVLAADGWTVVRLAEGGTVLTTSVEAEAIGDRVGLDLRVGADLTSTWFWRRLRETIGARWQVGRMTRPIHLGTADCPVEAMVATTAVGPYSLMLRDRDAVRRRRCRELGLTGRQAEIARLVIAGATNVQIGRALGITASTVRKHLEATFSVVGVQSRAALVAVLLGPRPTGGPDDFQRSRLVEDADDLHLDR